MHSSIAGRRCTTDTWSTAEAAANLSIGFSPPTEIFCLSRRAAVVLQHC